MGKKDKKKGRTTEEPVDLSGRFDASKPQFRKPKENETKVVIDERFAPVLTDPRFQLNVQDKYGRKKKKKVEEDLSAFYKIEKEDQEVAEGTAEAKDNESTSSSSSSESGSDNNEEPEDRIAYLRALSRGEVDVSSSEDEDTEEEVQQDDSDEDSDEDSVLGKAGILDPSTREEVEMTTDQSRFLAVTNLDWTHVRAVDVFAILSSFTPPGAVVKVTVYQSDFGMERLKEEEKFGPQGIWKRKKSKKQKDDEESEQDPESDSGSDENSSDSNSERDADEEDNGKDPPEDLDQGFDPEKLRAYEASKLKYYFAIAEFKTSEFADIAYKEVDGMEFEHSSAAADIRSVPADAINEIVSDRPQRDTASSLPSNYVPPVFVVNALQQSNVDCTWEVGDVQRESALTKYVNGESWREIAQADDLKAYLASDNSSDEEDEDGSDDGKKASKMRHMLGLDSDSGNENGSGKIDSASDSEASASDDDNEDADKTFTYVPGKSDIDSKIREKIQNPDSDRELTPFEKYLQKRKEKRREKRKIARERRKEVNEMRTTGRDKIPSKREKKDDFFMGGEDSGDDEEEGAKTAMNRGELELLVAGDEEENDYDMRGIERLEKNKEKKLRGARKRKEERITADTTGADFKIDTTDERFQAVIDGTDDRFGIDRTDPNFKETAAMKDLLEEQTRRRKVKRQKGGREDKATKVVPNVTADSGETSAGAAALSSLVSRIKNKVQ